MHNMHSRGCKACIHWERAAFITTVCCTVCALRWPPSRLYALRWPPSRLCSRSVLQSYKERLNAFVWSPCLSWWHKKKNPVKIKLCSFLLQEEIVTVQYGLKSKSMNQWSNCILQWRFTVCGAQQYIMIVIMRACENLQCIKMYSVIIKILFVFM